MEEIKIKPSLKIEIFLLLIGIFLLITIILSPIGIILISSSIFLIIDKYFRTYSITNQNEISNQFKFLNKTSQIYRIDQITSISLSQTLLEKIFNLGSIHFGIFGRNNPLGKNNSSQNINTDQHFFNLKQYSKIFSTLIEIIGLNLQDPIYEDKPSTKPINFWIITCLILFLLSFSLTFFLSIPFNFISLILSFFFLLGFIITLIIKSKIKSTKYTITNSYIKYEYNYIFGKKLEIIPLKKITNHEIKKNILTYYLFKVGSLKIFTGGTTDPIFNSLENFEKFSDQLKNILNTNKENITQTNINLEQNSNKEEILYQTRPGIGYFLTFGNLIFFLISIFTLILLPLYLIYLIYKLLLWKNTKYLFYQNRVVDISGVLNITKKEIYYKNIKHIKLERKFLFEKIFNQGTIYIYTPGTGFVDNKINSTDDYKQLYQDFKEVIL